MRTIVKASFRETKLLCLLVVFLLNAFPAPGRESTGSCESAASQAAGGIMQKTARGIVVNEDGRPVPDVNIIVLRSMISLRTDARGRFLISNIPDGASIIFSCRGYKTYTLPPLIISNTTIRVRMVKDPGFTENAHSEITDTDNPKKNGKIDTTIHKNDIRPGLR
jgi:hypothetical protein